MQEAFQVSFKRNNLNMFPLFCFINFIENNSTYDFWQHALELLML